MSLYLDPDIGHPLLSAEASALDPAVLGEHAMVAERVLGLSGSSYEGDDALEASRAVALQINYQLSIPPEVWALQSSGRGARSVSYRATLPSAYPPAAEIVGALAGPDVDTSGWATFPPRR